MIPDSGIAIYTGTMVPTKATKVMEMGNLLSCCRGEQLFINHPDRLGLFRLRIGCGVVVGDVLVKFYRKVKPFNGFASFVKIQHPTVLICTFTR